LISFVCDQAALEYHTKDWKLIDRDEDDRPRFIGSEEEPLED
jgi:hypothetical protein